MQFFWEEPLPHGSKHIPAHFSVQTAYAIGSDAGVQRKVAHREFTLSSGRFLA